MLPFLNQLYVSAPTRPTKVRRTRSARPAFEPLESRRLLTTPTFTVTNTGDTGPGSLRQALINANNYELANPNPTSFIMVTFRIGSGAQTIAPKSPLPPVPFFTFVDGTTQPGFTVTGPPLITLDGLHAGTSANGLELGGWCWARDLVIDDFARSGVVLGGSGHNVLQGDYIGIDRTGALARGNLVGVTVLSSSRSNTIGGARPFPLGGQGNVISGNVLYGVNVAGSASNLIANNQIGTDPIGTKALGNAVGVYLSGNAHNNSIGVETLNPTRNTISGNREYGVSIGACAFANFVYNDNIGTDITGTKALGNGSDGVVVQGYQNRIGFFNVYTTNVISGNGGDGVLLTGSGNTVLTNRIGTDITGTKALGNRANGVFIQSSSNNEVDDNIISGNVGDGVDLTFGANHNSVTYNYIGTDVTGTKALGNGGDGLLILNSSYNVVGGGGNTISANGRNGVEIAGVYAGPSGAPSILNSVTNNRIGTDQSAGGADALGNKLDGVLLRTDANVTANSYGNQIGYPSAWLGGAWGTFSPQYVGNTIAYNGSNGVEVTGVHMVGNPIRGNSIYANHNLGISLQPPASWNAPVLQAAQSGTTTVIQGYLTTSLSFPVSFSVDFYASAPTNSPGLAQGRRYLGTAVVTASNGYARFMVDVKAPTQPGEVITATATDYWGTTTQFSSSVTAVTKPVWHLWL
jgi:parallel beta-helix repeat protein